MLAEAYTLGIRTVAGSFQQAMRMPQLNIVLMIATDDSARAPLSRLDFSYTPFLKNVQAAAKGANTRQLNQQCLINLDQRRVRATTSVSVAYIIGNFRYRAHVPMSRKPHCVKNNLDASGLREIPDEELKAILRGADEIVGRGGRTLLKGILRGSRSKAILVHDLDRSPVHGFFRNLPDGDVLARIDWAILNGYLRIDHGGRLPLLTFTQKGWEIERENYAIELLAGFDELIGHGPPYEMEYLMDRNREMILILLDKVADTNDAKYIPLLEAWRKIDYLKVRRRIGHVIDQLMKRNI